MKQYGHFIIITVLLIGSIFALQIKDRFQEEPQENQTNVAVQTAEQVLGDQDEQAEDGNSIAFIEEQNAEVAVKQDSVEVITASASPEVSPTISLDRYKNISGDTNVDTDISITINGKEVPVDEDYGTNGKTHISITSNNDETNTCFKAMSYQEDGSTKELCYSSEDAADMQALAKAYELLEDGDETRVELVEKMKDLEKRGSEE